MAEQNEGRRGNPRDYTLSFDEFIEIIGAIREIPRIYSSIEKMEANIQKITLQQSKDLADIGKQMDNMLYRVEALEQAAREKLHVDVPPNPDKPNGTITQKDLLNLVVRFVTAIGVFGSIIYALIQGIGGGH